MFTILMNSAAITGVQASAKLLTVYYGGDTPTVQITNEDETFEYYYNHFVGQKTRMLEEAKEQTNNEVGPVGAEGGN